MKPYRLPDARPLVRDDVHTEQPHSLTRARPDSQRGGGGGLVTTPLFGEDSERASLALAEEGAEQAPGQHAWAAGGAAVLALACMAFLLWLPEAGSRAPRTAPVQATQARGRAVVPDVSALIEQARGQMMVRWQQLGRSLGLTAEVVDGSAEELPGAGPVGDGDGGQSAAEERDGGVEDAAVRKSRIRGKRPSQKVWR